jgi:hypothetical protein
MTRDLISRVWPGLLTLAWLLNPQGAEAWGPYPALPVSTESVCILRFDMKCGPEAFARPAGPWYSYFPVDPHLIAQPHAAAFPNWPSPFPPPPQPVPPLPVRPAPGGLTYYSPAPVMPYGYGPGVSAAGYYVPQPASGYWYAP